MATRPHHRLRAVVAAVVLLGAVTGCSSVLDRPALPAAGTADARTGTAPTTPTAASITPVTPNGLLAGPGVTDQAITLAVLADAARDRGFAEGVRLWQRSVNTSGGVCGRTVELRTTGADGVPAEPSAAYGDVGTSVLGLLALPDGDPALAASIAADQVPAVTPTGTSGQLGPSRPIVAGATADILTINGLDHLARTGTLRPGDPVGVLVDGSATARDALRGARWWARENGVELDARTGSAASWTDGVVLAPTDPATVAALVTTSPTVSVLTLLDGFDPTQWSPDAVAAAAGRVYVATPAPAYGSDYPAAVAVSSMAAALGASTPGPRTLDGYAVGTTWERLIGQACADRSLTRSGIWSAATTVGPAPPTSLFGPSDPGLPVSSALPATRVSALSVADAGAATGLRSLTTLDSAPGIADYEP